MAKDDKNIWIFIGIAVLVIIIFSQYNKPEEMVGLNVHYYKNGIEVFPQKLFSIFSIVTPPGGSYDAIRFSVTIKNNGQTPVNNVWLSRLIFMDIYGGGGSINAFDGNPSEDYYLYTGNYSIGQSKTITSSLIPTSQFEEYIQPVMFSVNIYGTESYKGSIISSDAEDIQLSIVPEGVSIKRGSLNGKSGTVTFSAPFSAVPTIAISQTYYSSDKCPFTISGTTTSGFNYNNGCSVERELNWIAIGS